MSDLNGVSIYSYWTMEAERERSVLREKWPREWREINARERHRAARPWPRIRGWRFVVRLRRHEA